MKYFKKLIGERIYLSPKGTSEEEIQKFTEWLNDSQEALAGLWENSEYISNLTAEELLKMPFKNAQKAVEQFTMKKRIDILEDIEKLRIHYYNQMGRYGNGSLAEQISPAEFKSLLGKVKHIEIVQNWLYGII